jgi:hypothetical protein
MGLSGQIAGATSATLRADLAEKQRELRASESSTPEALKRDLAGLEAAVTAAEAHEDDVAQRLSEAAQLLGEFEIEYGGKVSAAEHLQTRSAVEEAVMSSSQFHTLLGLCREKRPDDPRFHWARAMRVNPRKDLEAHRRLSPMLQPGPGREIPVVDRRRWAHLRLEELPDVT